MRKLLAVLTLFSVAACGQEDMAPDLASMGMSQSEAEHWTPLDDPNRFGQPLDYKLRNLPLSGHVAVMPWIGSYWPTVRDSINYRWNGRFSQSAAEKYGRAFGGGRRVEDYVSAAHGVDSFSGGGYCTGDGDCGTGSMCGRRHGSGSGKCIPTWWGICDAWAAASLLTPEPLRPVKVNGVTFNIADIKGLVTIVHKATEARHIALRCYSNGVNVDGANRARDPNCRDTNPGTYHLLLGNMLGKAGTTFIEDRSVDMDVWNHPVVDYKVTRMQVVDARQANGLLGIGNNAYPYNQEAVRLVYVENKVTVVREDFRVEDGHRDPTQYMFVDNYRYILELDRNGSIIGGEWVGDSKYKHPDFLWLPVRAKGQSAASGAINYNAVMDLARYSY